MPMIRECIITTIGAEGRVHIAPLGLIEDGEGWICAEVDTDAEPRPRDPMPPGFWNSLLPVSVHAVWHVGHVHGRVKYEAMKALHKHPWQQSGGPERGAR